MDCNEFRQMILGDPSTADGEAHLESCADCQAYVEDIHSLDATLKQAMAIDVPPLSMPELPKIDADKVVGLPTRRRSTAPVWLATAAAVTLAAFIGINNFTGHDHGALSLADEIIAHMDHEPYALRVTDVPVSDSRLSRVVPANIANLSHDAGLITYAQSCEINGQKVPHLVIQGERGPVTILLLPNEKVDAVTPLTGERFNGVLVPVGDGSIAIIGEDNPDNLERIQKSFESSVTWST